VFFFRTKNGHLHNTTSKLHMREYGAVAEAVALIIITSIVNTVGSKVCSLHHRMCLTALNRQKISRSLEIQFYELHRKSF
jgi:hypothetical protein